MSYSTFPDILGEFEVISIGNPIAGATWGWTPAANLIYRPLFVQCRLAADANVADRLFRIQYELPVGTFTYASPSSVIQLATESIVYNASQGAYDPAPISDYYSLGLPPLYIDKNGQLQGRCDNIQVGDQFSNIQIGVLKWRK